MMRYPSDLRVYCVKDEGKKKLTVTFKTAHNDISCRKMIIKKKPKTQATLFYHIVLSPSFPLFFPLKLCSLVISAEIFNLKCTISGFYNPFLCTICNQKQANFHFNIAIGTVFHKCTDIFQMRWNSGKLSCLVTVSAEEFCSRWRAVQCTLCGV